MSQLKASIGELCRLVKGSAPTMKTEPGPYPFVVTAAFRRTAAHFDLEGPSICVPLISSTGHGDAAIHRIHYQDGKFALANLLVALQPKNPDVCHPRFLYHLLSAKKDQILVPLMQGTANVSLKVDDIAGVRISLPPLEEQRRIVARIEALLTKVDEAHQLMQQQSDDLRYFWKALSRAARELPHPTMPLEQLVEFLDGRRVPLSEEQRSTRKGPYPYYGASDIIDHIDDYIFDEELLLLSEDGANLVLRSKPIAFIASGKYWVNNHAHVLRPDSSKINLKFLQLVLSDYDVSDLNHASAQPKLNQKRARTLSIPVPPLAIQERFVAQAMRQLLLVESAARENSAVLRDLKALLPAILDRAFEGDL